MSDSNPPAILAEGVDLGDGNRIVCSGLSFRVAAGTIYALMGGGHGPAALLLCLLGRSRPVAGRLRVFGDDPRRRWRLRSRRAFVPQGQRLPGGLARGRNPGLLLLENVANPGAGWLESVQGAARRGTAVFLTTGEPAVASMADRIGILARGRLVADEPLPSLLARFRRIRFVNRLTETRTAFGTELDDFDAVRVRVRGWGVEAIVSNFEDASFERLRAVDGVGDASVEVLTLAEVLEALGEPGC